MKSNNLREVNEVDTNALCVIYETSGHATEDRHTISAFRELLLNPSQVNAITSYNRT